MAKSNIFNVQELGKGMNYASYNDKFICIDNFNQKDEPKIASHPMIYNSKYNCRVTVMQGCLHLKINGAEVKVKSNDHLLITPCTQVEIISSRCKLFCILVQGHILDDVAAAISDSQAKASCFIFKHYHFTTDQIAQAAADYDKVKKVVEYQTNIFKEAALRARLTILLVHIQSYETAPTTSEIVAFSDCIQKVIFFHFIDLLQKNYLKERTVTFYASSIGLTQKQLSGITRVYAGSTASKIIDQYVAYCIILQLYKNKDNIKTISTMFNFSTQSFFGRYFKRVIGVSPRDYIRLYSKKLSI